MFNETTLFKSGVVLMLCLSSAVTTQPVIPSQFITAQSTGVPYFSANGSSCSGRCSSADFTTSDPYNVITCTAPSSSVLFDGVIPTLTGLDGNMWASQLLTLYIGQTSKALLNFEFNSKTAVNRVEVDIFNCPEMEIAVDKIVLTSISRLTGFNNVEISSVITPMPTSCDSLVTVHIPCTHRYCNAPTLGMEITPSINLVYIAEIQFFKNVSSPPLSPTTPLPTSNNSDTPSTTDEDDIAMNNSATCPVVVNKETTTDTNEVTTVLQNNKTTSPPNDTDEGTTALPIVTVNGTTTSPTEMNNQTTGLEIDMDKKTNILPIILSVVGALILLCVVGVVLLLWRCYCAKHHKHNTTALGEGTHASPHPHSHPPPITLCEETGQALYSVVQDEAGEERQENQYSSIQHSTTNNAIGGTEADTAMDQLYAQVDKKKRLKKDATAFNHPLSDTNTAIYAQVDKKKRKKKDATVTPPHPSADNTAVDQLYARAEKKSKKKDATATSPFSSETNTAVDQLYAQVDKKRQKKSKEMKKEFTEESGAVYSVVNKPRAPQLPPQSDLLMEDDNEAPPLPPQSDLLTEY